VVDIDYAIEEMLLQSPNQVVYKARGRNGFRYTISRFIFTKSILANLKDTCFDVALKELKRLNHGCLRPVIDGGLDEIDGMPWVARVWWDGEYLDDRMNSGVLTPPDIQRLADHGQALIDALGDRASAISFRARDVILTNGQGGHPVETFNIDVQNWFLDWAMGVPPGGGKDARTELSNLVTDAENSEILPMTAEADHTLHYRQLTPPPPPPPTQALMVVAPPPEPTQSFVPSPAPSQPLVPTPAFSNQGTVPAPPATQPLMQASPQSNSLIPTPAFSNQASIPAPTPSQLLVQAPVESSVAGRLIFGSPGQARKLHFR
jgi:hypothetical protein